MESFLNISSYLFAPVDNLPEHRQTLRSLCKGLQLKGTILLSTEGINLFVAGFRGNVEQLLNHLRQIPGFADLQAKESFTEHQPFRRMLVKIKKEIIVFNVDGIEPAEKTSPKLPAETLKQWLDEGKQVTLLDVRNDYEVELGTFENALPIGIDHFRKFPDAVKQLPAEMKQQPVVMFCTGGIRCEKAGPMMERAGFEEIYQLDGGILKYFEKCQGEHYEGDCFVFDQRVAVDCNLNESATTQCYACQATVTEEEQQSDRYEFGKSCPHCFKTEQQKSEALLAGRNQALQQFAGNLPGSTPYDNHRPVNVPKKFEGYTALNFLAEYHPQIERQQWENRFQLGRITNKQGTLTANQIVKAGQQLQHLIPATIEPDVNPNITTIYEDDALVVINKPAPIPMHPCGQFNRNTLSYLMQQVFHPWYLRHAHRLDANTTGVVVYTKTRHYANLVQSQFKDATVKKCYLAKIQGSPKEDKFTCDGSISQTPEQTGLRVIDQKGLAAKTEFEVLQRFDDDTTLLSVRPITGRTNQIRVHLWHLGMPICGDKAYLADQKIGNQQTLTLADAPLCLHAKSITLVHPISGEEVSYTAPNPAWAE